MSLLNRYTTKELEEAPDYYFQFPVGECPAKIVKVTEKFSKRGNEMLEIVFENDEGARISYYLVDGEYFLKKLKALYTAFDIPLWEKNTQKWLGKQGIVVTKLGESYDGNEYPKVSHVRSLRKENTTSFPAQQEPNHQKKYDDDVPF